MSKLVPSALALLLLIVMPHNALAAPGQLDTSFDGDGKATTSLSSGIDVAHAVVVQPDGKIVVAGISDSSSALSDFAIVRYLPDGALDMTFAGDGKVTTDFGGGDDEAYAVAIQADAKLIVAGIGAGDFALARYNMNGSLDLTFDMDGKATLNLGGTDSVNAVKQQPDGKIVVVGHNASGGYAVRYLADGSLDTGFDTDGIVVLGGAQANAVALQSDGKIVVVGASAAFRLSVRRLNPNGSPDSSFGVGGMATYSAADRADYGQAVAIQPDGKIVAAGISQVSLFGPICASLVRFSAGGTLENAVNNCNETPGSADYRSLLVQPDGKLFVGGYSGFSFNFMLVRYNPDFSLDTTFNGTGTLRISFETGMPPQSEGNAIAFQPDGKIVIAGVTRPGFNSTTGQIAVARVLSGLSITRPAFDFDGDRKADVSVFRPSDGYWYLLRSQAGFTYTHFGIAADKLAPADYDGDGRTDLAVFRENPADPTRANFYLLKSSNGAFEATQFGATGDLPLAADWDGDGRDDLTVYRDGSLTGGQSYFFYRPSTQPATVYVPINWGVSGDRPVMADYDGDGKTDAAAFRPANATWYVLQSSNNLPFAVSFGTGADTLVPADYDGDGRADLAVFEPSTGNWRLSLSTASNVVEAHWGQSGDVPVPADYDGDWRADLAVFRGGTWYLLQTTNGYASVQFGIASDRPVPGAFVP